MLHYYLKHSLQCIKHCVLQLPVFFYFSENMIHFRTYLKPNRSTPYSTIQLSSPQKHTHHESHEHMVKHCSHPAYGHPWDSRTRSLSLQGWSKVKPAQNKQSKKEKIKLSYNNRKRVSHFEWQISMVHGTGFGTGVEGIWQAFEDILKRTASSLAPPHEGPTGSWGRGGPSQKERRHYVLFQSSVTAQSADLDITNGDTDAGVELFLCMTEGEEERQAARPELTLGDAQTCPRSALSGMRWRCIICFSESSTLCYKTCSHTYALLIYWPNFVQCKALWPDLWAATCLLQLCNNIMRNMSEMYPTIQYLVEIDGLLYSYVCTVQQIHNDVQIRPESYGNWLNLDNKKG